MRYEVQIQPVRLTCNGCTTNRDYVVAYEKRSVVEFATQPQPCMGSGEVNFCRPTDPITVAPFILMFDTAKERREVEFAIYDFTNRPKSVERLMSFRVAIGHQVNVVQKETFCGVRDWPFREGRMNGTLRVLLRMHPVGTQAPAIGSGSSQTQAVATGTFSKDVLAQLHQEGLVPTSVTQMQVDADILEEIATKIQVLKVAAKVQDKLNPKKQALWSRMTELQAELTKLEEEHRDATRSLDAADAHVYRLLQDEEKKWASLIPEENASRSPAHNDGTTAAADPALVRELEQQKAALEKKLQFLESQHAPMTDVMAALNELQTVSALLEDMGQQPSPANGQAKASRSVHFKPTTDAGRAADDLFDALSEGEALDYALRVGQHMQRQLYDGVDRQLEEHNKISMPTEFGFVNNSKYAALLTKSASVASSVASALPAKANVVAAVATANTNSSNNTKDFFNDLFAPSAASAPPRSNQPTAPRNTATSIDDLFGAAPSVSPPPPAVQQRSSQPPPASPPPQLAPQAAVEKLPVNTTTEFVSFFNNRSLRVKAQAFRMTTPARAMRVSELTFQNGGSQSLTISGVQVLQEDFFSSNETEVPCHMGTPFVEVPAGEFKSLMLSFGPSVSMTDSLMVLLKLKVGDSSTDSVRITL